MELEIFDVILKMNLLDYTEKSFVVIGDTKDKRKELKELGGRYNPNLTHPETKEKLAGWIFSKKQKEKIQAFLTTGKMESSSDPVDSLLDPIHRLGLRENGPDPPKKKRGSSKKREHKLFSEPSLESANQDISEFQEIPSFTMIVPKVGMKVKLKNEDLQELVLVIQETHKNKDGYILEFRAVDPNNAEIVLDFVMVGKEWKRYTTEEPHWMNIV
jgi:hypothetical protein